MACDPTAVIRWIQANERLVGLNHPDALSDTLNRPLRDFITALGLDPDVPLDGCSIGGGVDAATLAKIDELVAVSRRVVDLTFHLNAGINDGDNLSSLDNIVAVGPNELIDFASKRGFTLENAIIANPLQARILDQHTWIQMTSSTGAGRCLLRFFRTFNQPFGRLNWRDSYGSVSGTIDPSVPVDPAIVIMSWMRKSAGADATTVNQSFGFEDYNQLAPSATIPRAGLLGDGAGGFRYGSVNCPDGGGNFDNGATDIDAGAVQPADLVAPGTTRWHTAIKIVPPTQTSAGKWAAYHNGTLVKIFDTVANFPRGSAPSGVPNDRHFSSLECIAYIGNVNLSWCLYQPRFVITRDTALGSTLTF